MIKKLTGKKEKETPKMYAANSCDASCSKCNGKCAQNSQHSGQHKCGAGHSW